MNQNDKLRLIDAGMNVDDALQRFMNNEAILEKFMKKFLEDPSYDKLKNAVEEKNLEEAFSASHTLKGVAANFSFEALQNSSSEQCELFRAGNLEDGIAKMAEVTAAYDKIKNEIIAIFG